MTMTSTKNRCLLYAKLLACVFALSWTAAANAQQEDPQEKSTEMDFAKTAEEDSAKTTEEDSAKTAEEEPAEPPASELPGFEEIVITGSRIPRSNVAAPNPVTSISSDDIEYGGSLFLNDVVTKIPQLQPSMTASTSTNFIGTAGLSTLDLRGLGSNRTLVLVNGRRHVGSSSLSPTVDINTIPQDLIRRIEILTGGASATYGSDAVSGVVNFVLDDNFEGVVARGNYGMSSRGDSETWYTTLTAGSNFAEYRGNAVISFEINHRGVLRSADRAFSNTNRTYITNPDDADVDGNDDGIPDKILTDNAGYAYINRHGAMFILSDNAVTFNPDGSVRPWDFGDSVDWAQNKQVGGDYLRLAGLEDLMPRVERYMATALVNYDLIEDYAKIYSEAKIVYTESQGGGRQPSFDIGNLIIHRDNAFLPTQLASFYDSNGLESASMYRFNMDLGQRDQLTERLTMRSVLGVKGEISENLSYDVGLTWGRTSVFSKSMNNRVNARFFAASDAVVDTNGEVGAPGEIVCRVNLQEARGQTPTLPDGSIAPDLALQDNNGRCVPLSLFGEGIGKAAQNFVNSSTALRNTIEQIQLMGYVTASTIEYLELPGGPIGFVLGGEFRRDQAQEVADLGDSLDLTFFNAFSPSDGKIDLAELFTEISFPILSDMPGVNELTASAGGRISNYSLSQVGTIMVGQVNAVYSPIRDMTIRASYSLAVRAPNVGESFGGASQNYFNVNDPCDADSVNDAGPSRVENCQILAEQLGFSDYVPGTTTISDDSTREGLSSGNPNLSEETSKSWTIGTVITPRWVPGLSISVDYYNFRIDDAIAAPGAQRILDNCVDFGSIDNKFCQLITRDSANMEITQIISTNINLAALETQGIDFEIYESIRISELAELFGAQIGDWGRLDLKLNGNRLIKWINFPDQLNKEEKETQQGFASRPKWRWGFNANYFLADFTFSYNMTYQGSFNRASNKEDLDDNPDFQTPTGVEYRTYHGIQARYRFLDMFEVYAGVNNLFDNKPPINYTGTTTGFYDPIGRFFYTGAKINY